MGWRRTRGATGDVRLGGQVRVARSPELQRASSVSQLGHGGRETAKEKPPLHGVRTSPGFSRVVGRGDEGFGRRTRFERGMYGPDCLLESWSVVFYEYGKWIS